MGHIWSKLWRLKISDRIKLVTWRLYHNSLPVFTNLKRRGCTLKTECVICGYTKEDANHLFFTCWWAQSFWELLGMNNKEWMRRESWSIGDRIWFGLSEEDPKTLCLMSVGIWMIWFNRNKVVHGENFLNAKACCSRVDNIIFQSGSRSLYGFFSEINTKPDDNSVLCFYSDGSWSQATKMGGWASVVYQNHLILRCKTGFNRHSESAVEEELYGIVESFYLAKDMGINKANFYSDSTDVIWSLQSGCGICFKNSEVFSKGVRILRENQDWNLVHILREDNSVADSLANKARKECWQWDCSEAIPFICSCAAPSL